MIEVLQILSQLAAVMIAVHSVAPPIPATPLIKSAKRIKSLMPDLVIMVLKNILTEAKYKQTYSDLLAQRR